MKETETATVTHEPRKTLTAELREQVDALGCGVTVRVSWVYASRDAASTTRNERPLPDVQRLRGIAVPTGNARLRLRCVSIARAHVLS